MLKRTLKIVLCLIALMTLASACSTKKNTWLNRNFHNMSAYYNIYWNGRETYRELEAFVENLGYDNYSKILRVFEYGSTLDTAQTVEKTTRMIEKGTKAVQKHSMRIHGVEYVKTMERAYMLMGIGHFYRHDYSTARTVFNFVSSQFPNSPIRYESLLWSARAYIQEKEFEMASALILQVRNQESRLYKQTYRDLPAVAAEFYILQGQLDEAIPHLQQAISRSKSRDFRNRMHFILGQIHQQQGRLHDAYNAYRYVTRNNARLDLDYNARINMALCYGGDYADRELLSRELKKMLQDVKNERFFGRIYYVLAEMAIQDRDLPEGIEYLKKSVEYSGLDRDQLAISATRLADLFFDEQDYATAQRYYNNAVSVMTADHADYDRVSVRAKNLTQLVQYLDIVRYEKQMQHLAGLPESQREEAIAQAIEDYQNRLLEQAENAPRVLTQGGSQATAAAAAWYFYNEQAKSFGANEFVRRWGRRTNEDFWFLQQKPNIAMGRPPAEETTERTEEGEQRTTGEYTPNDREYYLVNMPLRATAKERSNARLEENLFMLGAGYFDLVEEPKLGIQTLEELLERFPGTGYKLQAYYYLYRMNLVQNNQRGMQKYRDLLVAEFPNAEQTRQITDPDFFRRARENTLQAESLYRFTFEAYQEGFYDVVIENVRDAERRFPGNALMPQFKYLETMAMGSLVGLDATVESLEQYIRTFPQERELVELARTTIEFLRESQSPERVAAAKEAEAQRLKEEEERLAAEQTPQHDITMYEVNSGIPHYCLIFVAVPEVNVNTMKVRLADFRRRSFPDDNLRISDEQWDEEYHLIYVYSLRTASVAEGFLEELRNSQYVFGTTPKEFYDVQIISAENFVTLMRLRNREAYRYFFEQNYNP